MSNDLLLEDADAQFCIFLGAYDTVIPIQEALPIGNIKGAICVVSEGIHLFYSPLYATEIEADEALANFKQMGLTSLEKLIYYQEMYYTESEFTAFKEKKKASL